jgi:hypothetical protein
VARFCMSASTTACATSHSTVPTYSVRRQRRKNPSRSCLVDNPFRGP